MANFWHGFFQVALTAGQIFLAVRFPQLAPTLNPVISATAQNLHQVEVAKVVAAQASSVSSIKTEI